MINFEVSVKASNVGRFVYEFPQLFRSSVLYVGMQVLITHVLTVFFL